VFTRFRLRSMIALGMQKMSLTIVTLLNVNNMLLQCCNTIINFMLMTCRFTEPSITRSAPPSIALLLASSGYVSQDIQETDGWINSALTLTVPLSRCWSVHINARFILPLFTVVWIKHKTLAGRLRRNSAAQITLKLPGYNLIPSLWWLCTWFVVVSCMI